MPVAAKVLRSASGTLRFVETFHDMAQLGRQGLLPEQLVLRPERRLATTNG